MNERVPLSFLITQNKEEEPPVEPVVPFAAFNDEEPVIVTAVLERTVAFHRIGDRHDTGLRRTDLIKVDPAAIEWRAIAPNGQPRKKSASPWRNEMEQTYERAASRKEQREKSDARAAENKRVVEHATAIERVAYRQRQEKEKAMDDEMDRTKVCVRCGKEKPASEFPRGLLRPGRVCGECKANEGEPSALTALPALAEARAVDTTSTIATPVLAEEPRKKRKYTRRAKAEGKKKSGRPRKNKQPDAVLTVGVQVVDPIPNGYANVIKLLQKRDSLKAELAKVNEQLLEALA